MNKTTLWLLGGIVVGIVMAILGSLTDTPKDSISGFSAIGLAIGYICTIGFVSHQQRRMK